jgi:cob(I)alamin adenosyltransferase
MVRLTRIYTKTGDKGTTALGDASRTSKTDLRIEAFATVDEANSYIGVAMSVLTKNKAESEIYDILLDVQNDMFDVGADLCTPVVENPKWVPLRVTEKQISALEGYIDLINGSLNPLKSFVLPSGTAAASHLHVARAVVRRAERDTWRAIEEYGDGINPLTAKYLNRLSDLLFVLARYANLYKGDILWIPGGKTV